MSDQKEEFLIIQPAQVSDQALSSLIEEYILREGTDYGHSEKTLDQKKQTLKKQLASGHVLIVYSTLTENTNLMLKSDLPDQ